jgi:hypothetical protein
MVWNIYACFNDVDDDDASISEHSSSSSSGDGAGGGRGGDGRSGSSLLGCLFIILKIRFFIIIDVFDIYFDQRFISILY